MERPLTTDPDEIGGMTVENFGGFDVPFSHFEKYIQKIDCANVLKTAIIVKEEQYLAYTMDWFKEDDYQVFYEKTDALLNQQLREYESKNNLKQLLHHLEEGPKQWYLLYYYEIEKKVGFYEVEAGYQRKGMNVDFGYFYQDDKCEFVLREDFERAYKCIDYFWESDTEEDLINRKKNFKENFLDKYEFGASYLSVSY